MPERITFTQSNRNLQDNLAVNYAKLDKLQQQLASGKRLNRPSDDPTDVSNDLELRAMLSDQDQYQRNLDDGTAYLGMVDSTLTSGNNLYQHLRERAVQGATDTITAQDRVAIADEARVVLDQLVGVANTTFKGGYLFSGTNTQAVPYDMRQGREHIDDVDNTATAPDDTFLDPTTLGTPIRIWDRGVTDSNTASGAAKAYDIVPGTLKISGLQEGTDYTVDYVKGTVTFLPPGTRSLPLASGGGLDITYDWIRRNEADLDGTINRQVEKGVEARINTTATDAFGDPTQNTSWDAIVTLLDGLYNDNSAKVRSSLGQIDGAFNRNLAAQSANGARMNRFDSTSARAADTKVQATDLQSKLEDVDFAQAVSDMNLQQAVYNASLQTGARIIQHTLADFL